MYTDEIIDKLITCQKKIVDGPKTVPTKGAWVKKSFTLSSEDGLHNFNGFITCNDTYSTFETALQSFVKHIGLNPTDKQKYFPSPSNQEELPFAEL